MFNDMKENIFYSKQQKKSILSRPRNRPLFSRELSLSWLEVLLTNYIFKNYVSLHGFNRNSSKTFLHSIWRSLAFRFHLVVFYGKLIRLIYEKLIALKAVHIRTTWKS